MAGGWTTVKTAKQKNAEKTERKLIREKREAKAARKYYMQHVAKFGVPPPQNATDTSGESAAQNVSAAAATPQWQKPENVAMYDDNVYDEEDSETDYDVPLIRNKWNPRANKKPSSLAGAWTEEVVPDSVYVTEKKRAFAAASQQIMQQNKGKKKKRKKKVVKVKGELTVTSSREEVCALIVKILRGSVKTCLPVSAVCETVQARGQIKWKADGFKAAYGPFGTFVTGEVCAEAMVVDEWDNMYLPGVWEQVQVERAQQDIKRTKKKLRKAVKAGKQGQIQTLEAKLKQLETVAGVNVSVAAGKTGSKGKGNARQQSNSSSLIWTIFKHTVFWMLSILFLHLTWHVVIQKKPSQEVLSNLQNTFIAFVQQFQHFASSKQQADEL